VSAVYPVRKPYQRCADLLALRMDATLLYFSRSAAQPASAWISRLERAPECRVGWGLAALLENMLGDWGTASELRADHYTEGQ
jgi:hypothetical protein